MKSPLAPSPTAGIAGIAGTAMDAVTLCEAFQRTTARFPSEIALATADGSTSITWSGYADRVERIAAGLAWAGVGRGDTVAMMLTNRPEAMLVDTAALHLGATPFSIYNSSAPEQIVYLLTNAAPRVVVTEAQFLGKLLDAREQLTTIEYIVVVGARDDGRDEPTIALADLERRSPAGFDFHATWRQVDPGDVATLIYTSGTTGPPKGVQLTHDNIVWKWRSWNEMIGFEGGGSHVSYLPMAHIGDRTMAHYLHLLVGGSLVCVEDYNAIVGMLPAIRPTVFTGMPRLWEKLKSGMERSFAAEPDPGRRRAVQHAVDVGVRRVRAERLGQHAPPELASEHDEALSTVLATVRAGMGMDRVELLISGGAPIAAEVLQFFSALGLPICEGWGLSEAGASVTVNPRDGIRIGTVGLPTPGVELRQLDDGEILIRGPLVMKGYRNDPVQTAEAIDDEGWLHSGDIGRIDDEGYLTIIDRKKNLIITSSGKNMSPNLIESHVRNACTLVGQILVVGDGRPFVTALLQLDHDALGGFAKEHGITTTAPDDLITDTAVLAAVQCGIDAANVRLSRAEQIKKFVVVPGQWVPDSEEMTPTAKLRRRVVITKYESLIQSMYGG